MTCVQYEIEITIRGPVLVKSSAPSAFGLDASVHRDTDGNACIPESLIVGKLRDSWTVLTVLLGSAFAPPVDDLLGARTGNRNQDPADPVMPHRGRLTFTDFTTRHSSTNSRSRTRIQMNSETHSVKKGALQAMEDPFMAGSPVAFAGTAEFFPRDNAEAERVATYLRAGLKWLTSIGSERTIGFGRILSVDVAVKKISTGSVTFGSLDANGKLAIRWKPQTPFCIASKRVNDNLFESSVVIPGGALKGAFASTWMALISKDLATAVYPGVDPSRAELCEHFEHVRFGHAFPAGDTHQRPVEIPQSVVQVDCDPPQLYFDVALCGPVMIHSKAPRFAIDWKSSSAIEVAFGHPKVDGKVLRVRTAMDRTTRSASEGSLFAYESIAPEGHEWLGNVDFEAISDLVERELAARQFQDVLAHGVRYLGKTAAAVKAEASNTPFASAMPSSVSPIDGNRFVVTLQTPALLADPEMLDESSGENELFTAYESAWTDLSDGALKLQRFFAWQALAGGYYLRRRFQETAPYRPYFLTRERSVFILQAAEDAAVATGLIQKWHIHGLPVPAWVKERYERGGLPGDHWQNCPFIPSNGYGEIAVNLSCHTDDDSRPKQEDCYVL